MNHGFPLGSFSAGCPYCEIARLREALELIAAGETQYGMNAIAREALSCSDKATALEER